MPQGTYSSNTLVIGTTFQQIGIQNTKLLSFSLRISVTFSVQVGKEFDALIIDTAAPQGDPVFDTFEDNAEEVWHGLTNALFAWLHNLFTLCLVCEWG